MSVVERLAQDLFNALESGIPIPPLREEINNDIRLAYLVQEHLVRHRLEAGERIIGKKIGLTSPAVQKQLGVDQPDYGMLFHTMDLSNAGVLEVSNLIMPKAEGELAFILKEDLDKEDLTLENIKNAIGAVVIAIEVVDSRVENWKIGISDTIADNASGSHFILGPERIALENVKTSSIEMKLYKNDELVSEGSGAACMGDPLNAALWLAQIMKNQGSPLLKGEVLLSGALGPMVPVSSGDELTMTLDGFKDLQLSVR